MNIKYNLQWLKAIIFITADHRPAVLIAILFILNSFIAPEKEPVDYVNPYTGNINQMEQSLF